MSETPGTSGGSNREAGTGRRSTVPVLLTLALLTSVHLASPAAAADIGLTTGFRMGVVDSEIGAGEGAGFQWGPVFEVSYQGFALGVTALWSSLDLDPAGSFPGLDLEADGEADRFDLGVSAKYKLSRHFTPFVGYRNLSFGDLRLEATGPGGGTASAGVDLDLGIDLLAVGTGATYPLLEYGLVPFCVGTLFPWGQLEGEGTGLPGFSVEGGAAYLIGRWLDLPIYVTATVKYQSLSFDVPVDALGAGTAGEVEVEGDDLHATFGTFFRLDL